MAFTAPVTALIKDAGQIDWLLLGLSKQLNEHLIKLNCWQVDNKKRGLLDFGKQLHHSLLRLARARYVWEWGQNVLVLGSAGVARKFHAKRCNGELMR